MTNVSALSFYEKIIYVAAPQALTKAQIRNNAYHVCLTVTCALIRNLALSVQLVSRSMMNHKSVRK